MSNRRGRFPPLLPLQQLLQRQLLENQVGLATLIHDADVAVVHPADAGVAAPAAFIQQDLVLLRPGHALVEAELQGVAMPGVGRIGIGE